MLSKITEVVRHEGLASLWFRALARVGYWRAYFLILELADAQPGLPANDAIAVRALSSSDGPAYSSLRRDVEPAVFRDRLRGDEICVGAFDAGDLVAVTWLTDRRGQIFSSGPTFPVARHQYYLYDTYTHPERRGEKLHNHVFRGVLDIADARGKRQLVSIIVPENRSSLNPRRRHGFRRVGLVRAVRLGRRTWVWSRGQAPTFSFVQTAS